MKKKLPFKISKFLSYTVTLVIIAEVFLQLISFAMKRKNTPSEFLSNDENVLRIVTIGESTTASNQFSTNIEAWPLKLEKLLQKNHISAKVYNLAVPATTTNIILSKLESQIALYHPQIVISMMGINDSNLLLSNQSDSIINKIISLKIIRWFYYTLNHKERLNKKLILSSKNFSHLKNTPEIIDLIKKNDRIKAEKLIQEMIAHFTTVEKAQYYAYLAEFFIPLPNSPSSDYINSYHFYKKSLEYYFWVNDSIENFSHSLVSLGKTEECFELAQKYQKNSGVINNYLLLMFGHCASKSKENEKWKKIFKALPENFEVEYTKSSFETTKNNYRKLHTLLNKKNIHLIAMQYPLTDPAILKYYFQDGPNYLIITPPYNNIEFADNQENFKKELETHTYDEIFVDRFAGYFGHTTNIGHELISKTANDKVIDVISKYNLINFKKQ